ncbi:MAG: polysaccharide biosynthesis/export family protein [Acidobacteria bacterium]|nr:polysaccharide biosynthesis/export family protein [Acidobacteriota bacterium]
MKTTSLKKISLTAILAVLGLTGAAVAQTPENTPAKKVNFGYSQNPKTRTGKEPNNAANKQNSTVTAETVPANVPETTASNDTIAKKTLEVVKNANKKAVAPTQNYKVGVGDVLFINLQNNAKGSTYYTVLNDGTIDYPLAGQMVSVAGLNTDEIEDLLREKIRLYENPQVSVKIRDYASHKISVLGLVEKSGDKFIQREAVPLFVVRAEAVVSPNAVRVVIRRGDATAETYELKDEKTDEVLVLPNDIVEFQADTTAANPAAQYFYIGGEVVAGGQKDFHEGLTLTQAILVSGGLKRSGVKKVVIRRKNADGMLVSSEYNLKQIKDGKAPDPVLMAGDTVEVGD